MKNIFYIGVILFCFIGHVEAQKIDDDPLVDSMKADITKFFIKQGLLDKQTVKDSRDYVSATEIMQKRSIGYDTSGIYRIFVHQSHSREHILIKHENEFRIFNLEDISKVLKEVISYSEKTDISDEILIGYLKAVIDIYQRNYNTDNTKVRKVQ